MKTFKVKNYKGNLVESLSRFIKSHGGMKIIEAKEEDKELKIKAEAVSKFSSIAKEKTKEVASVRKHYNSWSDVTFTLMRTSLSKSYLLHVKVFETRGARHKDYEKYVDTVTFLIARQKSQKPNKPIILRNIIDHKELDIDALFQYLYEQNLILICVNVTSYEGDFNEFKIGEKIDKTEFNSVWWDFEEMEDDLDDDDFDYND